MKTTNTQNEHSNHYAATRYNSLPFADSFMQTDQRSRNTHSSNFSSLALFPASPLTTVSNEAEHPSYPGQTWNLDPSVMTAPAPFSFGYPYHPTDQGLHRASQFAPDIAAYAPSFHFAPTVFPGDYAHTGLFQQGLRDDDEEVKRLFALYIADDIEDDEQENGSNDLYSSIREDSPAWKSPIMQKVTTIHEQKKRICRRTQTPWSFFCKYCQKHVSMSRKRHMTKHSDEREYQCMCGAEFKRKDKRDAHVDRRTKRPNNTTCEFPYGDRNSGRIDGPYQPSQPSSS